MSRLVSATTPFPNVLLDEAMPCLKDTEWRVLCVIVRQTLGWQARKSKNRKVSDWLTQAQLVKKTGRDRAALSRAIDALVRTRFIEVRNEQGDLLSSPAERRHCKGRLFFALHPRFLVGPATKSYSAKSECQMPVSNSLLDTKLAKSEYHRASKANTTKETGTKENPTKGFDKNSLYKNSLRRLAIEAFSDKASGARQSSQRSLPWAGPEYSAQARDFIALFKQVHQEIRNRTVDTRLNLDGIGRLETLLASRPSLDWTAVLQAFFESDASYISRHSHSLSTFLDSCHIFLVRHLPFVKRWNP